METPVKAERLMWTAASMRNFLERFYAVHNPDKLSTIDLILERYRGHEGELFLHLKEKYDVAEFCTRAGIEIPEESESDEDDDNEDIDDEEDEEGEEEEEDANKQDTRHTVMSHGSSSGSSIDDASSTFNPNGTTTVSMVQDLSHRLLGWQQKNSIQSPSSTPAHKQAMTPQSHHMQQRASTAAISSSAQYEAEKSHLLNTIAKLKRDNEIIQRNLVVMVDKESTISREYASLQDQLKAAERARQDLQSRLEQVQRQRETKQQQLEETVLLNHRLGGQVRYLAAKAYETLDHGHSAQGHSQHFRPFLQLPEFSVLEKKIAAIVNETCMAEMQGGKSAGKNGADAGDVGGVVGPNDSVESQAAHHAAILHSLEVMHSSFMASRIELRLSNKQNAACEQRIAEQQMSIESLQQRIAQITHDKETASGSADHLKRQLQEFSADLASHKVMLAMAERESAQRGSDLAEARDEVAELKDSVSASAAARADLVELCALHTAGAEKKASEYVRALSERVTCEREEFLSRLTVVSGQSRAPSKYQELTSSSFFNYRSQSLSEM